MIVTWVLAAIGILQLIVFGYQALQLRKTVQSAADQSEAMKRSIEEAARLATAMEGVASDMAINARAATESVAVVRERTAQQMRAYLCVLVGDGLYQERAKNIKFQPQPLIVNTGQTPAYKVSVRANAAILSVPLPIDFAFPLSDAPIGAAVVGPHQNTVVSPVVDGFHPDADIEKIKQGNEGLALYTWGVVSYEDVFQQHQQTKFCQIITWLPDGKIFGYFHERHNEAT